MAKFIQFYVTLIVISVVSFNSGFAQNQSAIFTKALPCFNDKFIYRSCNEEYRLTQSGHINVPPEATDQFCYGQCLSETDIVLDCVDQCLTTFVFNNNATVDTIRSSLLSACKSANKGHFIEDEYMLAYLQDGYSKANLPVQPNSMLGFIFSLSVLFYLSHTQN